MNSLNSIPPESFRIEACGRWFLVSIAPNVRTMKMRMRRHVGGCHPGQLGCVVGISGSGELDGCAGFVFLPRDLLGASLVTHELAHAAFRLCDLSKVRVRHWRRASHDPSQPFGTTADASEEVFCDILETLTREFWTKAYATGSA